MKVTRYTLRRLIIETATALTDKEMDILDIGPSHPDFHRVARKAERAGHTGAGPGGSDKPLADWEYKDKAGAAWRAGAHEEFLKMIEKERGMAVIAEPMIAMGMDPTDDGYSGDVARYKQMLKCAMALSSHLDRIIKLEQDLIYREFEEGDSGEPSTNGAEHLYDRRKLYRKIMGWTEKDYPFDGFDPAISPKSCSRYDPAILKKVLEVQATNLRPMPAYTPDESEKELEDSGVTINESRWIKLAGIIL
jgi:hypothetical protein